MRANGLAKGGSLENAVVVGDDGILNSSGLRFHDEFVRHKILDTIGDISLIGFPIQGHLLLEKAGHTANLRFLKKLLASTDCFHFISEVDHVSQQVLNYGRKKRGNTRFSATPHYKKIIRVFPNFFYIPIKLLLFLLCSLLRS